MAIIDTVEVVFSVVHGQFVSAMNSMNTAINAQIPSYRALTQTIEQTETSIAKIGIAAAAFGAGVKAAIYQPLEAAMEFEQGFSRLKRLIDDTSEISNFKNSIQGIISTVPVASKELFKFGEEALKAGANSVEAFEDLTKLGAQLEANVGGPVGNLLTQIIRFTKGFGEGLGQVRDTANEVSRLANAFSTAEPEILKVATRIAPMGKSLGLTKNEVLALANAMREVNVTSEAGGTVINQFIGKIQEGIAGNHEILSGIGKIMGKTMQEVANAFRSDPSKAIGDFLKGLENAEQQGKPLVTLLKSIGLENARQLLVFGQLREAINVYNDSLAKSREVLKETQTTQGQANQIWDTTANELKRLKNNIDLLQTAIGKGLNREVRVLSEVVTAVTKALEKSPLVQSTFAQALITFALNTVGIASALTGVTIALGVLGTSWTAMGALLVSFAPWAAIAAGAVLIVTHFKEIKEWIVAFSKYFGADFTELQTLLSTIGRGLQSIAEILKFELVQAWRDLGSIASQVLTFLEDKIENVNRFLQKFTMPPLFDQLREFFLVLTNFKMPLDLIKFFNFFGKSKEQVTLEAQIKFGKQGGFTADKIKELQEELEVKYGEGHPIELPVMEFEIVKAGSGKDPFAKLGPDEKLSEILEEYESKLEAIGIKYKMLGDKSDGFKEKSQRLREELSAAESAFNKLVDIKPRSPEVVEALELIAKEIHNYKEQIAALKEEIKFDKADDALSRKLKEIQIIAQISGDEISGLRQQIELLKSVANKSISLEIEKTEKLPNYQPDFSLAKSLYASTAPLEARIEELQILEKIKDTTKAYLATLDDLAIKQELAIITPLQKEKAAREAAMSALLSYTKLQAGSTAEAQKALVNAQQATLAITELTIASDNEVELQKAKNEVYREAMGVLEGIRGSTWKYQNQVESLGYLLRNSHINMGEYKKAYSELTLKYIQSQPVYKELEQVFNAFSSAAVSAFEDILENGKLTSEGLKGIAKSILSTLGKIIAQVIATKIIMSILGGSAPLGSTGVKNSSGIYNYPSSTGLSNFAGGGVVTQTGMAMLHAPEAVVPIQGGSIPVHLKMPAQKPLQKPDMFNFPKEIKLKNSMASSSETGKYQSDTLFKTDQFLKLLDAMYYKYDDKNTNMPQVNISSEESKTSQAIPPTYDTTQNRIPLAIRLILLEIAKIPNKLQNKDVPNMVQNSQLSNTYQSPQRIQIQKIETEKTPLVSPVQFVQRFAENNQLSFNNEKSNTLKTTSDNLSSVFERIKESAQTTSQNTTLKSTQDKTTLYSTDAFTKIFNNRDSEKYTSANSSEKQTFQNYKEQLHSLFSEAIRTQVKTSHTNYIATSLRTETTQSTQENEKFKTLEKLVNSIHTTNSLYEKYTYNKDKVTDKNSRYESVLSTAVDNSKYKIPSVFEAIEHYQKSTPLKATTYANASTTQFNNMQPYSYSNTISNQTLSSNRATQTLLGAESQNITNGISNIASNFSNTATTFSHKLESSFDKHLQSTNYSKNFISPMAYGTQNTRLNEDTLYNTSYANKEDVNVDATNEITIINVIDRNEANAIAANKNAIINIISSDYENRGTTYRSIEKRRKR